MGVVKRQPVAVTLITRVYWFAGISRMFVLLCSAGQGVIRKTWERLPCPDASRSTSDQITLHFFLPHQADPMLDPEGSF